MRYFLLTLSAVLLLTACNNKPKVTPGTENILRAGTWKLSSGTVSVRKPDGKDTILDYLKFIPECYKDDYFVFDSMNHGRRFTGSNICSVADPEYFAFIWQLKGDGSTIDLFNGLNYIYGITDTIQPYTVDDLGVDTTRTLFFTGVPGGIGPTGLPMGGFDIYGADIVSISNSAFTIHFQMHSIYIDSTNFHAASYWIVPDQDPSNPGYYPTVRKDTFNYTLTFTN